MTDEQSYDRGKGAEDMKRILAILLCALLATLGAMTLAEAPLDNPFDILPGDPEADTPPRGDDGSGDGLTLTVNGEAVRLAYDASPQYSSIRDGAVQASYYGYGADGKTLYELYLTFPETARAGMIITPEYASMTNEQSSVVLIVSLDSVETYYFSSLLDGSTYPEGSGFTIAIDSVSESGGMISYAGTLSANLVALDMASGAVADTLTIPDTPFRFTVTGRLSSPLPDAPESDVPQFTPTPDDFKKV